MGDASGRGCEVEGWLRELKEAKQRLSGSSEVGFDSVNFDKTLIEGSVRRF